MKTFTTIIGLYILRGEPMEKMDGKFLTMESLERAAKEYAEQFNSIPIEPPVILQGELLPCPFCGGEASIGTTRISDKRTRELNNRDNGFFVNCKICGSNNNCLRLGYATKEIAISHWNKRAVCEPQSK